MEGGRLIHGNEATREREVIARRGDLLDGVQAASLFGLADFYEG